MNMTYIQNIGEETEKKINELKRNESRPGDRKLECLVIEEEECKPNLTKTTKVVSRFFTCCYYPLCLFALDDAFRFAILISRDLKVVQKTENVVKIETNIVDTNTSE